MSSFNSPLASASSGVVFVTLYRTRVNAVVPWLFGLDTARGPVDGARRARFEVEHAHSFRLDEYARHARVWAAPIGRAARCRAPRLRLCESWPRTRAQCLLPCRRTQCRG